MRIRTVKFNFIMNAILTVSSILFPLITFPYISRVLLVEGSGKVAFATSVVSYFTMFATLGIPTYGIRACARVRDDKEKLSQTVQELLIISGITTAITYAIFFILLFIIPQFAGQKELLIVMGVSIGLTTIGVQWFYSALEQYSYITVCAVLFKIIGLILMFLLVKEPKDYIIYGSIHVVGSFGSYILNFLRLRKFITLKKQNKYNLRQHGKGILTFFLLSVATSVYLNLDLVMLGFMKGDVEVGYYNAGIKVKTVLVTCVTSLGTVLLPRLSYYIQQKKKEEFQRMVTKAFQFVLVVSIPMTVYFIIYVKESILFLAGESFLPATAAMIILMPTLILIGLSNITGIQILTPLGRESNVVCSVAAGAVLDFVLNLVLIPKFGSTGAAFSTTMAELLVLIVQCIYLRKQLWEMVRHVQVWKIVVAIMFASIVGVIFQNKITMNVFGTLCVSAILFFGVYGVILLILKEDFVSDTVESLLKKIWRK